MNRLALLPPDVGAAAAAIANARAGRRGAPPIANVLDFLPERLFDEVVEDARAALAAAATVARGPIGGTLTAFDADALRLTIGAGTVLILATDRHGRATAALSAASAGSRAYAHDKGAQLLREAVARAAPGLDAFDLTPSNPPDHQEPRP